MPDQDTEAGHSSRLLRGLIWVGVVLAPLAAAIVLLGQSSTSVRFAVLLIAVSVVLIGASVLIRNDPVLHRMHVEDRVAEEIAALRSELRAEFARGGPARPAPGESDFFRDAPMLPPAGDQFDDPFPLPAPPAARRPPAPAYPGAARAGVPAAAAAAVRPAPPNGREPGRSTGARDPGMAPGGRVVAGAASVPSVPRQRGAASVPPSAGPPEPPRASAAVRPGVQYGRPETLDGDFGASDGYAGTSGTPPPNGHGNPPPDGYGNPPPNGYGGPARNVYGSPPPNGYGDPSAEGYGDPSPNGYGDQFPNGYDGQPSNGYGNPGGTYGSAKFTEYGAASGEYGQAADHFGGAADEYDSYQAGAADAGYGYGTVDASVYGPADGGYDDASGYGLAGGYDGPPADTGGDPNYRARRHRPSANDTNVGSFEDFASYGGWSGGDPVPDERYVQGYGPARGRR